MSLRIIQLGVGGFGRAWRYAIENTPEAQIVGLVDCDEAALAEGREHFGLSQEQCFSDIKECLASVESEVVIDSTPHRFHFENAKAIFAAGKHLAVVKPMSIAWDDAKAMVAEAERTGCKMVVAQQLRYHPLIMKVREIITSGSLGAIGYVHLDFFNARPAPNQVRWYGHSWGQPYPVLVEGAIHHFDYLRWCLGEDAVTAWAESWNTPWIAFEGEHCVYASFKVQSGCRMVYRGVPTCGEDTCSWLCRWRVEGENGLLTVENDRVYLNGEETSVSWEDGRSISDLNLPALNKIVLDKFLAYVQDDEEPEISGKNNLNSIGMVFGAVESAQTGRRIEL